ncbi:MAG: metallophosphoesterase, partial [Atopobiaceae bacterium]|nr:metallophosphoesterase [Atopobiaceae bacterium]
DLVLIVIADIHYATGCIWSDTIRTIRGVSDRISPDAIVQLGDLCEGTVPDRVAESFAKRVMDDLRTCGVPVLGCVGNHDVDRLSNNRHRIPYEEFALLCTGRNHPWYREDFPEARTSCLFLKSYDPKRKEPFGFEPEQRRWLHTELVRTPRDWKLLVFSHLPLHAEFLSQSDRVLNELPFKLYLKRFNKTHNGALAAFIHGHNHTDHVYLGDGFPSISIGCARLENPKESGSDTSPTVGAPTKPVRKMRTASQELWDVLILKQDGRLELIRFGAGEDLSLPAPGYTGSVQP